MFLSNRYQYLLLGLCFLKPRSIIEIGLAQGVRAYQMVQFALKYNSNVKYTGYDVFDTKNDQWHKLVGNGKKVSSKAEIKKQLNKLTTNIELIEGMTANTLWTKKNKANDSKSEDKTKTIQELDREKSEKKFSKEDKEKLN